MKSLESLLSLEDYGIVWNEGERVVPEIWMLNPARRFTYFAHLALYEFASQWTRDAFVLDFGSGMGYGAYHLAALILAQPHQLRVHARAFVQVVAGRAAAILRCANGGHGPGVHCGRLGVGLARQEPFVERDRGLGLSERGE